MAMTDRFTTRVAVFVIIRNDKGELLLQQRAGTNYLDGYWDFPSGHVEAGESIRDTAIRELAEETGLTGRPEALRLVHIDQYFLDAAYLNFVFALDSWQGTPTICEPEKCAAMGWYAQDALPSACVNMVRVVAAAGFSDTLTYSLTDEHMFYDVMQFPRRMQ
jgi:8-oxo-dGTP diphosphatase